MRIDISSSGNFEDTIYWLRNASRKNLDNTLSKIGEEGVEALRSATPIGDTGETANGWQYKIEHKSGGSELSFVNRAHPEAEVNVARVIDSGHATGTGGFVSPRPYIRRTMDDVFRKSSNLITEELMK